MAKVFKSKIFLGIICLILAAAIAFLVLPNFYASKSVTTHAVKLAEDVPVGTVIADSMLVSVEVGSYGLPSSTVMKEEDAIGKVASENMYTGEFLTATRLITEEEYQALVAEQTKGLENGYCLVTIQFPGASSGVASVLRSGHIVDVHECVENEDKTFSVQKVLSSMYVYAVLNADLQSLSELDVKLEEAIVEEDTDYNFEPAFVVFRCTETQAQTLIRLERMEAIHLTLQRTGG